ncbi:MAG: ATPase, partial [Parasporobacterium sp.]|nr:ATPase [Parasporobacterium sp.]
MKDCLLDLANTALGIELGSTRIKAVLIDADFVPLATGIFEWENHLEDGIWTYSSEEITTGLQKCFADLKEKFKAKYGRTLSTCGAIGLSAMMHGYLPFDEEGNQLTPFRTWRNTITGEAAEILTGLFGVNIPQRWSVAHLYQAFLNKEEHLKRLAFFTTLSGFLHWKLTGIKVIGIGDASGMFPIDPKTKDYDQEMLKQFETLCGLDLRSLLPKVLTAGEPAGILTQEGALLLDPSGDLSPGIPLAPCEGDAGTGMAATNAVAPQTGNVSAGTSAFAMIVTDRQLSAHREVDMVTTPAGDPVAMVHCNNCTSDLYSWFCLFREICEL